MYKVYRYEDSIDHKGPYTCMMNTIEDYTVCEALHSAHGGNAKRPSVRVDGFEFMADNGKGFRVACESIKQLKSWFKGFNKWLLESGFVLAEYTISERIEGISKLQCVFHLSNVIERKEISL